MNKKDVVHMYRSSLWHFAADYWARCGAPIIVFKTSGLWRNVTCKKCLARRNK